MGFNQVVGGETRTISVKNLLGRKRPVPARILEAQSTNSHHPGGSRVISQGTELDPDMEVLRI